MDKHLFRSLFRRRGTCPRRRILPGLRPLLAGAVAGTLAVAAARAEPATNAAAGEPISLPRSIELALKQNRDLKVEALSLESAKLGVADARAEFAFSLQPAGEASDSSTVDRRSVGLNATRKTVSGSEVEAGAAASDEDIKDGAETRRAAIHVGLEQPLLRRAGALVNREPVTAAESRWTAARRSLELKRTDMVVQVVEAYQNLSSVERQVEYEERAAERLERFMRLTQARERQGRSTRVDALRAELKVGEGRLRLNSGLEGLSSQRAAFAELLGFPPEQVFTVQVAPDLAVDLPDAPEAVRLALRNRLDYAQILQDSEDSRRGVAIARRDMLPDLRLSTRYERFGQGPEAADMRSLDESVWFVTLKMDSDFPLRKERIALAQARIGEQTSEVRIEAVRSAVARQVQQALLAYDRARKQVPVAERNYQLAQNRARLARRLYERGKGDNFSVADAEDERQNAQEQWIQAQAAATVEAYRLLRVLGILIEYPADLMPGKRQS